MIFSDFGRYGEFPQENSVSTTRSPPDTMFGESINWSTVFDQAKQTLDRNFFDAAAITRADFSMLDELQHVGWEKIAELPCGKSTVGKQFLVDDFRGDIEYVATRKAKSDVAAAPSATQLQLFDIHDVSIHAGLALFNGQSDINSVELDLLATAVYHNSLASKGLDWCLMTLKQYFQRPRPFQTAHRFNSSSYFCRLSQTAHTAAFPAGHTLQAAVVHVDSQLQPMSTPWSLVLKNLLPSAEWSASVGDNRILAGLHYPSDSIASWIVLGHIVNGLNDNRSAARAAAAASVSSSNVWRNAFKYPALLPGLGVVQSLLAPDLPQRRA
jgi:hypothetical protein